jgi:hypothetical protein
MAFADPQDVSYDGTTYHMPRISSGVNSGKFYTAMGTSGADLTLNISHQYGKRTRRLARLDVGLVNPNPFATGLSSYESSSYYLVADTPATNGVVNPAVAYKGALALLSWIDVHDPLLQFLEGQN